MTILPPDVLATGDGASGNLTRFSFVAPYDLWIVRAIFGFFEDYTQSPVWYGVGTTTPEEAADIFSKIYLSLGVDLATIGAIVPFAGGILPSGWLPCDGRSLVRADYLSLFQAIGTVWGAADGDHFNIPDLRGRTLVGQGVAATGTTFDLGTTGGEETHTLTSGEMPSHTHADTGHTHSEVTAVPSVTVPGELPVPTPSAVPGVGVTGVGNASIQNTGGGGHHNNMQPYAVVNYAIIAS